MIQYNFNNCFLEWHVHDDYIGRFNVECIIEKFKDSSNTFLLGSGVYACNVLQGDTLFKDPPYVFTPLFNNLQFTIFRDNITNKHSNGKVSKKFNAVNLYLIKIFSVEITENIGILNSIKNKLLITGSLSYTIKHSIITISFPIKHINYRLTDNQFQVETGPIALPYDENMKLWMLGYIAFNNFNSIEFLPISSTSKNVKLIKAQKLNTNIKLFVPDDKQ